MTEGKGTRQGGAEPGTDVERVGMRDIAVPFGPANPGDSLKIMGEAI